MIWESTLLMTVFDLLIIWVSGGAIYWVFRNRRHPSLRGSAKGLVAISFGLLLFALFYFVDLLTMYLFPSIVGAGRSMALMEGLHLNERWLLSLVAVGSIAFGIISVGRRIFDLTDALTAAGEKVLETDDALGELTYTLKDREASLANAQRIAHMGSWNWNIVHDSLQLSDEMYRIFGLKPDEFDLSFESFLDSVHPDERELVRHTVDEAVHEQKPFSIDHLILVPHVGIRTVHQEAEVTFEGGQAVRMSGTVQDITSRVQAEEEIRQSEARLRAVMDRAADGIITADETGHIESFNQAAELIFGYSAEEVRGQPVTSLMPTPDETQHNDYLGSQLVGQGPKEMQGRRRDGTLFPIEVAVSDVLIADRHVLVGSVRDIAERKQQEQQLKQAQKMEAVGQLTGGVAHDFNNILTSTIGNLEFLEDSTAGQPEAQRFVELALKSSNRAASLTKQLLAFSRKQTLNPRPTDVNLLVSAMTEFLRRTLGEDIGIENVCGGGLWKALIDDGQLESSILNLALNARDAMPGGGKLTIETSNSRLDKEYAKAQPEVRPGPYVMVAVSDTGCGMNPEVAERAFQPFFSTKEIGKGSGLGLSMVYGFVKQSGGHVAIYSEPNNGTTVKLYLPRSQSREVPRDPAPAPSGPVASGKERILVVEDDPDVRAFINLALGSLGYDVTACRDGPSAMKILDGLPDIDLLLTDVVLPGGMTGRELAERVVELRPGIRVLFSSGYTVDSVVHHGRLEPGVELLAKPYSRDTLARRIREILDN